MAEAQFYDRLPTYACNCMRASPIWVQVAFGSDSRKQDDGVSAAQPDLTDEVEEAGGLDT